MLPFLWLLLLAELTEGDILPGVSLSAAHSNYNLISLFQMPGRGQGTFLPVTLLLWPQGFS